MYRKAAFVTNEIKKITARRGFFVFFIILALMVGVVGFVIKQQPPSVIYSRWQMELTLENEQHLHAINGAGISLSEQQERQLMTEVKINKYRLEHNLPPVTSYSTSGAVSTITQVNFMILILVAVAAAFCISEKKGQYFYLLNQPVQRWNIYIAKYLACAATGLVFYFATLVFSLVMGLVIFGPDAYAGYFVYLLGDNFYTVSPVWHIVIQYLLCFLEMLFVIMLVFTINMLVKNTTVTAIASAGLILLNPYLVPLLHGFVFERYLPFGNVSLLQYFNGASLIRGNTFLFSLLVFLLYFCILTAISIAIFQKRDMK